MKGWLRASRDYACIGYVVANFALSTNCSGGAGGRAPHSAAYR